MSAEPTDYPAVARETLENELTAGKEYEIHRTGDYELLIINDLGILAWYPTKYFDLTERVTNVT